VRISERDLHLPTLLLVEKNPEIRTSELIKELEEIFRPAGEDAEILPGRSDTRFSQLVRNLVSHKSLTRLGYVTFIEAEEDERQLGGSFILTEDGREYLGQHRAELVSLLENGFSYEDLVDSIEKISSSEDLGSSPPKYVDENAVVFEGTKQLVSTSSYKRSAAVRVAAIAHYRTEDGRLVCAGCGFDFHQFYGELGRGFIEIHHEKPLYEFEEDDREKFMGEAVLSVKPLCSNCHRMVHRNKNNFLTMEQLKGLIHDNRTG